MEYISVAKMAEKWGLSERSVRNYCAHGRIADAKLIGKTWYIPENAQKPERANKKSDTPTLLQILREQKAAKITDVSFIGDVSRQGILPDLVKYFIETSQ